MEPSGAGPSDVLQAGVKPKLWVDLFAEKGRSPNFFDTLCPACVKLSEELAVSSHRPGRVQGMIACELVAESRAGKPNVRVWGGEVTRIQSQPVPVGDAGAWSGVVRRDLGPEPMLKPHCIRTWEDLFVSVTEC